MDVGAVTNQVRRVAFEFGGQSGWIDYRPHVSTLKFNTDLEAAQRDGNIAAVASFLAQIYTDWDLESNGQKIPVTPEGIASVPMAVLGAIDQAVNRDMAVPTDDEKKGSSAPTPSPLSGSTQDSPTSPTGSTNSTSLAPQPESSEALSPT